MNDEVNTGQTAGMITGRITTTTTINIPYPIKLGLISINRKKRVGLSFDNLALFFFREENGIEKPSDFDEWMKQHGSFDWFIHATYAAARSFAATKRKRFKLDKSKFAVGLANAGQQQLNNVTEAWKRSQNYGSDNLGKKKVTEKS